ncbi:DNA-processing protein DprA [Frankia sp. EAN1pec]|uniref:DNA-processing protein DprA n=1 Tax=Parafrankia sp. (strain EAN1pec) TaxID=298653 RepID=UPI0012F70A4D
MTSDDERHARAALTALPARIWPSATDSRTDPVEVWKGLAPEHPGVDPARLLATATDAGWRFVIPSDPGWPATLTPGTGPLPVGLWARGTGDLTGLTRRSVTITGARLCSEYGQAVTAGLAYDLTTPLAAQPVTITAAGIGEGIDAAALRIAATHRRAVAVLTATTGITRYNRTLLTDVADGGLVLCLAAPGLPPRSGHLLARVRLLATLTRATVLVESTTRGYAFATAQAARLRRRPVMAVPGPIGSTLSAGPNALLTEGTARLVTSAEDIRAVLDQT